MSAGARQLAHLSVLVTRPEHQSAAFCDSLQLAGAQTTLLPTIEIVFPPSSDNLQLFAPYKLLIFTSANAVRGAVHQLPYVQRQSGVLIAAIGPATTRALEGYGITVDITPAKHNSEGMLQALSSIDLDSYQIAILRGDSGRNLLLEQLERRAAGVRHIELYKRKLPQRPLSAIKYAVQQTNITCVSSDLGLRNLAKLLTPSLLSVVQARPLIVNSCRCAALAGSMGFCGKVSIATPPGDTGQLQALYDCAESIAIPP